MQSSAPRSTIPGVLAFVSFGLSLGCTGQMGASSQGGGGGEGGGRTDPMSPDQPPTDTPPVEVPLPPRCEGVQVGYRGAAIKRLTGAQFQETLRRLFPRTDGLDLRLQETTTNEEFTFRNSETLQAPTRALTESASLAIERVILADFGSMSAATGFAGRTPGTRDEAVSVAQGVLARDLPGLLRNQEASTQVAHYLARFRQHFADTGALAEDFPVALGLTYEEILHAPAFLYRVEAGTPVDDGRLRLSDTEIANRMSYLIWNAGPDGALLQAAAEGRLQDRETRAAEARRMLTERERFAASYMDFLGQWLSIDRIEQSGKDTGAFPMWSTTMRDDMRQQMQRFVEGEMLNGSGTVSGLLTSSMYPVNDTLAPVLGVADGGEDWRVIDVAGAHRKGLLTMPAFLASHAHPMNPSPTHRGIFIVDHLLCQTPPPPPPGLIVEPPETRRRAASSKACRVAWTPERAASRICWSIWSATILSSTNCLRNEGCHVQYIPPLEPPHAAFQSGTYRWLPVPALFAGAQPRPCRCPEEARPPDDDAGHDPTALQHPEGRAGRKQTVDAGSGGPRARRLQPHPAPVLRLPAQG